MSHPYQLCTCEFVVCLSNRHMNLRFTQSWRTCISHRQSTEAGAHNPRRRDGFVSHTSLELEVQFAYNCVCTSALFKLLGISYRGVLRNVY